MWKRPRATSPLHLLLIGWLTACLPELEVLPPENPHEGDTKIAIGRVQPGFCGYTAVAARYRPEGGTKWTELPTPQQRTGERGYHTYSSDIPGSANWAAGSVWENQWTVYVDPPAGWIRRWSFCPDDQVTVTRSLTFMVDRAFELTASPNPLVVQAGAEASLTIGVQPLGNVAGEVQLTVDSVPSGLTVTPSPLLVPIESSSGDLLVTAAADMAPASLSFTVRDASGGATATTVEPQVSVISPIGLSANPTPVELSLSASTPVSVDVQRYEPFTGSVNLTVSGLPAGVTASPQTVTVVGSSANIELTASGTAFPGPTTFTLEAGAGAATQTTSVVDLNVGRPFIDEVTPSNATRGQVVEISGLGFNPTCGLNTIYFGGVGVLPSSCLSTRVTAVVPADAAFGGMTVQVISASLESPQLPFRVKRAPGDFIDVTSGLSTASNRVCSSGFVELDVSGSYSARYLDAGTSALIRAVEFDVDTRTFEHPSGDYDVTVRGIGGAGFATCLTGVVLDANILNCSGHMAFELVNLETGDLLSATPHCFNIYSGITYSSGVPYYALVHPRILHSPDGSILGMVYASPTGPELRVALVDRGPGSGAVFRTVDLTGGIGGTVMLTVTTDDKVLISKGGTTYGPYSIP